MLKVKNLTLDDIAKLHKGHKEEIKYYYQTIKFLTKDKAEEIERFFNIYYNEANRVIGSAVQKYRKFLRQEGRGCVPKEAIIRAYENNNIIKLCELLSELALECITTDEWNKILIFMMNKGMTIEELYNKFIKRPNRRLISIVM